MLDVLYKKTASGGVTSTSREPNQRRHWRANMAKDLITPLGAFNQHAETEIWRPVPSEPSVLVSSLGRVLQPPSYAPLPNGGFRAYMPEPRVGQVAKSQKTAKHEYYHIMLKRYSGNRQSPRKVHQLVCEAFHGPKPFEKAVVMHLDEDALNNRPENLKWGTQKENLNADGFKEYCRSRNTAKKGFGDEK